jgi:hypothetical protein
MHPRLLAGRDCSGGSCPAVYDDDPDLQAGELAVVGKDPSAGLATRLSDHVAPGESTVIISRRVVAEALRPADEPVTAAEFEAQFETFSYSAFRLEAYQNPVGTARDDQWVALLKASRRWRKAHQRVRVVIEPLPPALQQELTEGYGPNVAEGEDIGIISIPAVTEWPLDVPHSDFWLFDSSRLVEMHYKPDGMWAGASRVRDPERIVAACQAREAALYRAVSWRTYIASRPDLQRRLAQ